MSKTLTPINSNSRYLIDNKDPIIEIFPSLKKYSKNSSKEAASENPSFVNEVRQDEDESDEDDSESDEDSQAIFDFTESSAEDKINKTKSGELHFKKSISPLPLESIQEFPQEELLKTLNKKEFSSHRVSPKLNLLRKKSRRSPQLFKTNYNALCLSSFKSRSLKLPALKKRFKGLK